MKHFNAHELRAGAKAVRTAFSLLIILLALVGLMLFPIVIFGTDEDMRIITNFLFGA